MYNGMKRWLFKQFQNNFIYYFIITILFVLGIAIGSITIKILDMEQKDRIIMFLNSFFKSIEGNTFENISILKQSIIDNFKTIVFIWITGTIVIGLVVIPIIILFRGFAMGFTVGFLVNEYGIKGLFFCILGIFPHNLLIIPSIISIASMGMALSIKKFRRKDLRIGSKTFQSNAINYSISVLFFSIFVLIGCLVEAYISPTFLRLLHSNLN
ncbi:MAG: stage II sporulation protein M [Tissierellia bacterium]|nr:stage II sporulation protein M [Tissierellia bacterium]